MCDICDPFELLLALSMLCLTYSPLALAAPGDNTGASTLIRLDARRRGGGGGGAGSEDCRLLLADSILVIDADRLDDLR